MNSIFRRLFSKACSKRVLAVALGSSLGALSNSAMAFDDVLSTPSMPSAKAAEHLLVDIERVGSRLVAVGARGHIVFSDDRGETWTQAQVPVSVLLTAVDFVSNSKGWAVGHGGVILHSNDGGLNWQKQFDGHQANQSIIDAARNYIEELEDELAQATGDTGDLEFALEDAEFALEDAQLDAEVGAAKPFLDVLFLDDKRGFAVGAYGFLFATQDGGRTWENNGSRVDNFDRFHLNAIEQLGSGTLIIAGEAGVLFQSTDEGESWVTLDSPYDGSYFGLLPLPEEGSALVFGLRGNLFRTDDNGNSWKELNSNTESTLMSGDFDGNRKVSIAGNAGTVIVSIDGGKTFSSYAREERLGQTSLAYITRQQVALVGESGVELVSPSGKNL